MNSEYGDNAIADNYQHASPPRKMAKNCQVDLVNLEVRSLEGDFVRLGVVGSACCGANLLPSGTVRTMVCAAATENKPPGQSQAL
jgi:hypothetical protein